MNIDALLEAAFEGMGDKRAATRIAATQRFAQLAERHFCADYLKESALHCVLFSIFCLLSSVFCLSPSSSSSSSFLASSSVLFFLRLLPSSSFYVVACTDVLVYFIVPH